MFIAEGEKVVGELLASTLDIENIYLTKDFLEKTDFRRRSKGSCVEMNSLPE